MSSDGQEPPALYGAAVLSVMERSGDDLRLDDDYYELLSPSGGMGRGNTLRMKRSWVTVVRRHAESARDGGKPGPAARPATAAAATVTAATGRAKDARALLSRADHERFLQLEKELRFDGPPQEAAGADGADSAAEGGDRWSRARREYNALLVKVLTEREEVYRQQKEKCAALADMLYVRHVRVLAPLYEALREAQGAPGNGGGAGAALRSFSLPVRAGIAVVQESPEAEQFGGLRDAVRAPQGARGALDAAASPEELEGDITSRAEELAAQEASLFGHLPAGRTRRANLLALATPAALSESCRENAAACTEEGGACLSCSLPLLGDLLGFLSSLFALPALRDGRRWASQVVASTTPGGTRIFDLGAGPLLPDDQSIGAACTVCAEALLRERMRLKRRARGCPARRWTLRGGALQVVVSGTGRDVIAKLHYDARERATESEKVRCWASRRFSEGMPEDAPLLVDVAMRDGTVMGAKLLSGGLAPDLAPRASSVAEALGLLQSLVDGLDGLGDGSYCIAIDGDGAVRVYGGDSAPGAGGASIAEAKLPFAPRADAAHVPGQVPDTLGLPKRVGRKRRRGR